MNIKARGQRGAALIVTLVLLVIALLLGLSSFQSSRVDESMAGNQRAGNMALMAAEHGASDFWYVVRDTTVPGPGTPGEEEDVTTYTVKILQSLADWANTGGFNIGDCIAVDGSLPNACYRILTVDDAESGAATIPVVAEGVVYSGGIVNGVPEEIISRRQVSLFFGVVLGESLSALNFASEIFELDGIASQATVEGEEVDGYVNPAISVGSRLEAEKIVRDILGNNDNFFNRDAFFIPDDPAEYRNDGNYAADIEGVYHHVDAIDFSQDPPVYVGNYDGCKSGSTRLCNYKGGVASKLGTPILSKPEQFDEFIGLLVTQPEVIRGDAAEVISQAISVGNPEDGKVFFVTNQGGGDYFRPVYDEANIREKEKNNDPDDVRLERDVFDLGGFDHKGILVVDGDVEFSGNPQFEGLIIVLGDYSVDGGGGDPFTGSVISAPYSIHFEDSSQGVVSPDRDNSGNFVGADGTTVIAPADSKVVMHSASTEGIEATVDDYPVLVDGNGALVYLTAEVGGEIVYVDENGSPVTEENRVLAQPYFGGNNWQSVDLNIKRAFDPSGFTVSGGGVLDYRFDYGVIEDAFDLMDDKTLLSWLIGQARLDGSFEYGLSSWREIAVPK